MIARDLMNIDFPLVTVDADLDYVAKLLAECALGAVPVVDEHLTPIGIVTRSNLADARAPDASPELGEIPAFLLRNRRPPAFHANGRALRDVMTAPAISVSSSAALLDIAQTMESRRLKRAPVVDGDKIVGLVLRKEVMEAISGSVARPREGSIFWIPPREFDRCAVATADEFRNLVAANERRVEAEREEARRITHEMREQRIRELANRRLSETQWRAMLHDARQAAESGEKEYLLIRFPAALCMDGGRAINAPDPGWPMTLRGEPSDVFHRWRNELQPRGFKIAAQIIDFPDGLPGDAALFLSWGAAFNP